MLTKEGCTLGLLVADGLDRVVDARHLEDVLEGNELILAFLRELDLAQEIEVLGDLKLFSGDLAEL
jgi:hypothetical protein